MEKKPWYCAKELVALDGIPNTPQAINSIARRDGWKSRKRVGIQGKAVEYEFNSLPLFIQEKILLKITQTELEQQKLGQQTSAKQQLEKQQLEKQPFDEQPFDEQPFEQRQNVAHQQEKPKLTKHDLKPNIATSLTSFEKPFHRTLESPKPTYLEYQVDLLKIWVDLFQQADITERYKMINFITHKGLKYLIAMINKELVNEPEKEKYHSHSAQTENNDPSNHSQNNHSQNNHSQNNYSQNSHSSLSQPE